MADETNAVVEYFRASIGKKLEGAPPVTEWLDGRVISAEAGELEVSFKVRPEMANPTGLLHGGMQSVMMDDVIGMASATLGEPGFMLTIDLHSNYLGKAGVGETVVVRARFVRNGRKIAHAVCEIVDESGTVVSRATANLLKTGHEPDYRKKMEDAVRDEDGDSSG